MSQRKSRFEGLFEPETSQPEQSVQAPSQHVLETGDTSEEIKKSRNKIIKNSRIQGNSGSVPRVKTNYEIRQDYVREMKLIAVNEGRKIYDVLEEAIGQYINQRHADNG